MLPNPKTLWLLVTLLIVLMLTYLGGYQHASRRYEVKLAQQTLRYNQERAEALEKALAEQQRLADHAQQIGLTLTQNRQQLATAQAKLKQRIPYVIQQDGPSYTGLGPDSLQLYQSALGYTAADLPTAHTGNADSAKQAPRPPAGLPPSDLIAHAADYGQWCQNLTAQLSAFQQLYTHQNE